MEKVSVLIPNWNGKEVIGRLLDSILRQDYRDCEVIIVDDKSTDSSDELIECEYPSVKLIRNSVNIGYAATCNVGLKHCTGKYILALNNDIELAQENYISSLVQSIKSDSSLGSVAGKLLFLSEKEVINNAGLELLENGNAKNRGMGEVHTDLADSELVFGACAGAALFSKEAIDKVGFFDEAYGAYLEDVDLAWRLQLAGYQCVFEPGAIAYHVHSFSYGSEPVRKLEYIFRNSFRNLIKYYPLKYVFGEVFYNFRMYKRARNAGENLSNNLQIGGLGIFKILLISRFGMLKELLSLLKERRHILQHTEILPTTILSKYLNKLNKSRLPDKSH